MPTKKQRKHCKNCKRRLVIEKLSFVGLQTSVCGNNKPEQLYYCLDVKDCKKALNSFFKKKNKSQTCFSTLMKKTDTKHVQLSI